MRGNHNVNQGCRAYSLTLEHPSRHVKPHHGYDPLGFVSHSGRSLVTNYCHVTLILLSFYIALYNLVSGIDSPLKYLLSQRPPSLSSFFYTLVAINIALLLFAPLGVPFAHSVLFDGGSRHHPSPMVRYDGVTHSGPQPLSVVRH